MSYIINVNANIDCCSFVEEGYWNCKNTNATIMREDKSFSLYGPAIWPAVKVRMIVNEQWLDIFGMGYRIRKGGNAGATLESVEVLIFERTRSSVNKKSSKPVVNVIVTGILGRGHDGCSERVNACLTFEQCNELLYDLFSGHENDFGPEVEFENFTDLYIHYMNKSIEFLNADHVLNGQRMFGML